MSASPDQTVLDALRRGALSEARAAADAEVAAAPADVAALRRLALVQQQQGETDAALATLDRAIALAPDEADAHFQRAAVLLGARKLDEGQAALAQSLGLDPNQFDAYVMQAQVALGRGDLEEAERLRRLAARVVPGHPHLAAIEGTIALRRGEGQRAQELLLDALRTAPENAQLHYALGFAYMQLGHLAFAEQAFRKVLQGVPSAAMLHALIADLVQQQGRPGDAAEEIAPLLADPARCTPGLLTIAGELELAANRPERALPHLRAALGLRPRDRRVLLALLETWRRLDAVDDARATLDAALATTTDSIDLWHARLALEGVGSEGAAAVVERWLAAAPDSVDALETRMGLQNAAGDQVGANETAQRIVDIEPGRRSAELRLVNALMERDPPAAVAHVQQLLAAAPNADSRTLLQGWLGLTQDRAGQAAAAVETWTALQSALAPQRLPAWTPSEPRSDWPEPGAPNPDAPPVAFLWGPPGSGVERVASLMGAVLQAFRADRFGPTPPPDALQKFRTIADLARDELEPAALVAQWRALLPQRGIDGQVVDWLLYWDNALLLALRPELPEGELLIALRDPRDMLLDWLAFGAIPPLGMPTPRGGAAWLAMVLNQVAALHERDLYPHRLLRLDEVANDPQALAALVGEAIGTPLPVPPASLLGPPRLAAGHWRHYAEALAEPFALLAPVARRLGYEA
ncbi:MAG TPA: tetratricopeptide repeat protein [Xanthomonadaceae bacterium]|nr:tetratricopeptide repeat protein [Xanthomonadaceae bacterium]